MGQLGKTQWYASQQTKRQQDCCAGLVAQPVNYNQADTMAQHDQEDMRTDLKLTVLCYADAILAI